MLRVKMRSCVVIAKCGSSVAWCTAPTTESASFVDFWATAWGDSASAADRATATVRNTGLVDGPFDLMGASSFARAVASRELRPQGGHHLAREESHVLRRHRMRHAPDLEDSLDDAAARLLQDLA